MSNLDAPENGNSNSDTQVRIVRKATEQEQGQYKDKQDIPRTLVTDSNTPWSTYLNSLNAKYQDRIKRSAQHSNYTLTMRYENGREEKQVFTRMKLLQYQYDEIEDLRAESSELSTNNKGRESTKKLSEMYSKAASYMLWNAKEERPMTQDEYNHCVFAEIRPALDASMLLGLISDPN